jgi:hypothetical protein
MTGRNQHLRRLDRAVAGRERAERDLAVAAAEAKAAGIPVEEIAGRLGYRTRKAVYDLLRRHELG